jgi:hypothetical protein
MTPSPKRRWSRFPLEDRLLKAGWFASIFFWGVGYLSILFQRTRFGVEVLYQPWGFLLQWFITLCLIAAYFLFSITSVVILMRWTGRWRS